MDFSGQVSGHRSDQGHFTVFGLPQHYHPRPQFLPQTVYQLPQGLAVRAFYLADHYFGALDHLSLREELLELVQGFFAALFGKLFFELPRGLGQLLDLSEDAVFAYIELPGHRSQDIGLVLVVVERSDSGHGLNAAHSSRHRLFLHDLQNPDVADALHVRASAQLLRVETARRARIGNGHHADIMLGIFVAEKSQRTRSQRFVERGHAGLDFRIGANLVVNLLLDVAQLLRRYRSEVRKIETQAVGSI